MPSTVAHIRVFVASPSDVAEERNRVARVVRELNLSLPREPLVQFELVCWETHAYPDFGAYPQDVVNRQLGAEYDIFVGILWSRIGTATPISPSGTLEEFRTAYERWKADSSAVSLMIYFKDEPIAPSQLDSDQLSQVQNFKKELPLSGGLFWEFRTTDEFETAIRMHLMRAFQDWTIRLKRLGTPAVNTTSKSVSVVGHAIAPATNEDEADLGFLDYMELVDEASTRLIAAAERITSAMTTVGAKTSERTAQVESLGKQQPDFAKARLVFEQSAHDLNEFSAAIVSEIPQLAQAHADLLKYLVGAAASSLDFGASGREQIPRVLSQLDILSEVIQGVRGQNAKLRGVISGLPRMTVLFNKAKRRAGSALDELDSSFADTIGKNLSVRTELAGILSRAETSQLSSPDQASAPE